MGTDQITLGIIGAGNIIAHHLEALKTYPDFRVAGVCDSSEARLRQIAAETGARGFADYHALLADKPDAVLIALPHGMHCRATEEAFRAGCHVLVEKPMAVSVAECNRMLAAADKAGRRLIVTETASFTPGALLTGEKFARGDLGRFFNGSIINCRCYFFEDRPAWFLDPAMSGGGMFSNVGLHRLAMARSCLRGLEPVRVNAAVAYQPDWRVEACTSAFVKYREGGAIVYEELGYYPKPDWLNAGWHFVFEQGIVSWDDKTWRMQTRRGGLIEESLPPARGYLGVYANMLAAIRGEPYWPKAREYAQDTAIAQAAYASANDAGEIDLTSPAWRIDSSPP